MPDTVQAVFRISSDMKCMRSEPARAAQCASPFLTGTQAVHGSIAVILLLVFGPHDCEVRPRAVVELRHNPGGGAADKPCTSRATPFQLP